MCHIVRDVVGGTLTFLGAAGALVWLCYGLWIMAHGAAEIELLACMILAVGTGVAFALVHFAQECVWRRVIGY
jgi:hypothetical protein